ncbi:MAG: hypothetical protein ABSF25_17835 [Bryobacteraceae bacterium]
MKKVEAPASNCARELIDDGQHREDVAALLNFDRATLHRALAS